ncbi:MAG: T9SS type A sorting domain-containing protein [Flavobacteriaceae bacterium]|nr:T9SS type A sorting domain-containing protein [Flavobacteriaceae bacterium]
MRKLYFLLFTFSICALSFGQDMVITGVFDGPLTGGTPKVIELYVIEDIADLSLYGVGSANNGGGTDGEELTFAGSAAKGDFIYVATEDPNFVAYFGFSPDYVSSAAGINGDDAVELFFNGSVIDTFGDINVDGTGTGWDHLDGWAYRNDNTGPDGTTFVIGNWSFSGVDATDGCTTNASCGSVYPIGSFTTTLSTTDFNQKSFSVYPNPTNTGSVNVVSASTSNYSPINVAVYDVLGKQVINKTMTSEKLNVSSLNTGVYIMKITQGKATSTKKLVIN